jgi:hypothetical protein
MVLIVTSFGATVNYNDQSMVRKTLDAYLTGLSRQTDQDFKVFISYHDKPSGLKTDYPFVEWCCVAPNPASPDFHKTLAPILPADRRSGKVSYEYEVMPFEGTNEDMSRKIRNSIAAAITWAQVNKREKFWMLSMDSDDFLAKDTISRIHEEEHHGARAVFSRTAHMFDPRLKEIAIRWYPDSLKCNAILLERRGETIPNWQYLNNDHTLFEDDVRKDGIPFKMLEFTFCILTNTGNNISGRPEIAKERNIRRIDLTPDLIDRYSLESLL